MERVLLARVSKKDSRAIDGYIADGGYGAWKRVVGGGFTPEQLTEEVKKSGLRGRGGAGFPTGVKWGFLPKDTKGKPIYLLCNADESEPGTFKDRLLMEEDPHQVIEGVALSAYAIKCQTAYIYIRGEFYDGARILDQALAEAYAKGFLGRNIMGSGFDMEIHTHTGAGAYICGEETALLSSLEGFRGHPRMKPPFPAVEGVYACPTVVNNVETLTAIPEILELGGDAWRNLGTEKSGGTKLWSVSGHVKKPGVYELPMGYADMEKFIMEDCGGMLRAEYGLKACIPGGSSVYIMNADQIVGKKVTMDYEGLVAGGSSVGSGGFIVMDESVDVVESTKNLSEFYKHESCGWCTPCREGTDWLVKIFDRITSGGGRNEDIQLMLDICDNIEGKSFCPLGDAAAWPIQSAIKQFPEDFRKWIVNGASSNGHNANN